MPSPAESGLHVLHIHAKIPSPCDCIHDQTRRVRQIEAKAARNISPGQQRLSVLPVGKLQTRWGLMKITAEQFAKQAARHDESIPVICEMKSIRPGLLFGGKRRLQLVKDVFLAVERRVPHLDFVPNRFRVR